jgi:hypothetical protein
VDGDGDDEVKGEMLDGKGKERETKKTEREEGSEDIEW